MFGIMAVSEDLLTYLTSATQRVTSQTSAESYKKDVVLESSWCRQLAQRPSLPVAGVPNKPRYFESSGGRLYVWVLSGEQCENSWDVNDFMKRLNKASDSWVIFSHTHVAVFFLLQAAQQGEDSLLQYLFLWDTLERYVKEL